MNPTVFTHALTDELPRAKTLADDQVDVDELALAPELDSP
jgi:hypothetical protein